MWQRDSSSPLPMLHQAITDLANWIASYNADNKSKFQTMSINFYTKPRGKWPYDSKLTDTENFVFHYITATCHMWLIYVQRKYKGQSLSEKVYVGQSVKPLRDDYGL